MKILLDRFLLNLRWFPLQAFILIWVSVIFIYQLKLFNVRHIDSYTYFIILIAVLATISGYLWRSWITFEPNLVYSKPEFNYQNLARLIWILAFFVLIGIYFSTTEIAKIAGGMNVFIENPFKIRVIVTNIGSNMSMKPTLLYKLGSYLINIGIISSFFAGILLTSKKFYFASLLPFFFSVITSFIYLSRYLMITYILYVSLSFIITYQYLDDDNHKAIIKRRMFYFAVGTLLFISSLLIGILMARNFFIDKILPLLGKQLYFYYAGGIATFDAFLHTNYNYTYGTLTLGSIYGWLHSLGLMDMIETLQRNQPFIKIAPDVTINTYTFIKVLYQDFGLSGLVLISFGWGFTTRYSVDSIFRKFSMTRLFLCVILIMSFIMSFFGFYLQGITSLLFRLILLVIITHLSKNYIFR